MPYCCIAFCPAACAALRSRSLLTTSTAAMVVDLGFFLVKVRETEPTLLWVAGIALGLALMAAGACRVSVLDTMGASAPWTGPLFFGLGILAAVAALSAALAARYPGTPVAVWPCAVPDEGLQITLER